MARCSAILPWRFRTKELDRTAVKDMLPMQPGEGIETSAQSGALMRGAGFSPCTSIEDRMNDFDAWYGAIAIRF